MTSAQKSRRERVLVRLESQLHRGTKTAKKTGEQLQLTEKDRKRIEKEIESLKK